MTRRHSFTTLKRWIYSDKVRAVLTPTGRWMIPESEAERIVGGRAEPREVRAVIYVRASSNDLRSDLEKRNTVLNAVLLC